MVVIGERVGFDLSDEEELENKASALMRELEIQRASLHSIKTSYSSSTNCWPPGNKKELGTRLVPGGAEIREVAGMEQRHAQCRAEMEDRLAQATQQYTALEDKFRTARTVEAARFAEVLTARHTPSRLLSPSRWSSAVNG
ncbi:hypothetical protein J4Q44_G00268650 [Coregonus suidteri]|uniref:Uncharacterized protein n=1 Tax=Coregonus suidteri TaxID=861788 RepID=A0AAN8QFC1_9TELE